MNGRKAIMPFEGPLTDYQEAILRLIGPSGNNYKAELKRRDLRARLAGMDSAPRLKRGPKPSQEIPRSSTVENPATQEERSFHKTDKKAEALSLETKTPGRDAQTRPGSNP